MISAPVRAPAPATPLPRCTLPQCIVTRIERAEQEGRSHILDPLGPAPRHYIRSGPG